METGNFWLAFGLTLFAGLSTGIGSSLAFFTKSTNTRFLSVSLGFSAGVMVYVSFVEILQKARESLISDFGEKNVFCGAVKAPGDKIARRVEGNIFGEFNVTSQKLTVRKLLPPVLPSNILGIGLNYKRHADETGIIYPKIPVMFLKAAGTVIGPRDPIILPAAGPDQVDFEAELAIVIKKKAKNVPVDEAGDYILGYTCANDVSARDWQIKKQKTQWARGKSFDTFCPLGPCLVTADEIPDIGGLSIQSDINGKIYQDSNTSDMIFDVFTIVSNLSQSLTLFPGTLILTGTPDGVGFTRIPPVFLRHGDVVTVSIEKIGKLINPVILESELQIKKTITKSEE